MFGGVFKWNSNYWCLSTIKLEQLQVKLTGWTVSKGQEIHNEGTRTNLLWAYDDPGKKTGWQNKVQGLASNVQRTEKKAWLPWRCSRAGCSCRRCTAARSEAAGSRRRDTGSSPPPAPTCPAACAQSAAHVQAEQSVVGGERKRLRVPGDPPNHRLDLLPVRRVDLVSVLWSHQHGGEAEGRVLQAGAVAFDHRRGEDGNNIYTQTQHTTYIIYFETNANRQSFFFQISFLLQLFFL